MSVVSFILDRNVMQNIGANGNKNVRKWWDSVNDTAVFLPVMAIREGCYGFELKRKSNLAMCEIGLEAVANTAKVFGDRVLPLDQASVAVWASLLAVHGKGRLEADLSYVAVAIVHQACLVTRNFKDMRGKGALLLDPFTDPPTKG